MKVRVRVPWRSGSAWKSGASITVKSGAEVGQLRRQLADEHVAGEEGVPGVGRDEADRQPVGRIGAGEEILDEHLTRIEISADIVVQALERGRLETGGLLPPDPVCRAGLLDDELVLGRPTGMRRRHLDERATIGEMTFASTKGVLDQCWRSEVGVNADGEQAVLDEGQTLARGGGHLGAHTLPWRVGARQRTSAATGVGRDLAGKYRQDPGRGQLRLE